MKDLLVIHLTMFGGCDTCLQVWLSWRWIDAVVKMVVAMEMICEMEVARVGAHHPA